MIEVFQLEIRRLVALILLCNGEVTNGKKYYRGSLKREVNKHEGLNGREIKIVQNVT